MRSRRMPQQIKSKGWKPLAFTTYLKAEKINYN